MTASDERIANDRVQVSIASDAGGRIAQIVADGTALLVGHAEAHEQTPLAWGSYPMVPWAGRIRHGRFRFEGEEYELPVNFGHHAIHGVGFGMSWAVTHRASDSVELELAMPTDTRWPFGGLARQRIGIDRTTVRCELSVHAGARAMPRRSRPNRAPTSRPGGSARPRSSARCAPSSAARRRATSPVRTS